VRYRTILHAVPRPIITRKTLGQAVRLLRETRSELSQERLGAQVGLDRTYVGGVERGERNPTFENLERLLGGLGITWSEFGQTLDSLALHTLTESESPARRPKRGKER
jgi:transcriptional regulator with XRE-family HTH domain